MAWGAVRVYAPGTAGPWLAATRRWQLWDRGCWRPCVAWLMQGWLGKGWDGGGLGDWGFF
jgi:hypothetical protein